MIFDVASLPGTIPQAPLDMKFVQAIAKKTIGHPAVAVEVEEMVRVAWKL